MNYHFFFFLFHFLYDFNDKMMSDFSCTTTTYLERAASFSSVPISFKLSLIFDTKEMRRVLVGNKHLNTRLSTIYNLIALDAMTTTVPLQNLNFVCVEYVRRKINKKKKITK